MILTMGKMYKRICLILGILFLFSATSKLWAYVEQVPYDLKKVLDEKYGRYQLFNYQKDEAGTYLVHMNPVTTGRETVAAISPGKKEKSSIIYESSQKFYNAITGFVYNPKDKTLYFAVYNSRKHGNNYMLFEQTGIYTVTKDKSGYFLKENLHRYYCLEEWVITNVCELYLKLPEQPYYDSFLNYLFAFADPGINPVFCITNKQGKLLTNKEAVDYIINSYGIDRFCRFHDEYYYFPLEKFLFVADEEGNPTEKSAVSYYSSDFCIWGRLKHNYEQMLLVLYDNQVYFTSNYGSEKVIKNTVVWSPDWSEVFKINHTADTIYITQPDAFSRIHACLHDYQKANNNPDVKEPLEVTDYGLVINDIDGESIWLYDGNSSQRFADKKEMLAYAKLQKKKPENLGSILFVINIFVVILLVLALVYILVTMSHRSLNEEKFKLQIQQNERRKISYDIHDSVVQDIRAIRIGTEMLEVQKSNEVKKDNLIANITNCIIKMRDICYGLSPAEFFDVKQGELVDAYSILQTLSEQFFRRTNIRCTVSADDEEDGFYFKKDDCYNIINIVQEALKNIEKHSFATSVQLFCRHELIKEKEYMTLFIIDDGKGCDINQVLQKKNLKNHFGLKMIKDHVSMIEGSFVEFFSAPGDGMQIKISLCGVAKKQNEK